MLSFSYRVINVLFAMTLAIIGSPATAGAQDGMPVQHAAAERSVTLTVTVGGVSRQFSRTDLLKMPQSTLTVHNAHTDRNETYAGVAISDLLNATGPSFNKDTQRTYLRSYIRAQGTDFYFVLYSAAEMQPELNIARALVATGVDGHDLGDEGQFKLVSSAEKRPARWVRNLLSLTFVTLN